MTAIIGSGLVGRAWAISFARAGHEVGLWDQDNGAPAVAHDHIAGVLDDLAHNDLLNGRMPGRNRPHSDVVAVLGSVAAS